MYPAPQFHIMKKGKDMYIKGEPLVYSEGYWLEMIQKKK